MKALMHCFGKCFKTNFASRLCRWELLRIFAMQLTRFDRITASAIEN